MAEPELRARVLKKLTESKRNEDAAHDAYEIQRSTPRPKTFAEYRWLTKCGHKSFLRCTSKGLNSLESRCWGEQITQISSERPGLISQGDRSEQVAEETTIHLLIGPNYQVSAAVGDDAKTVRRCIIDTGSGLNLVRPDAVPGSVNMYPVLKGLPPVMSAKKTMMRFSNAVKIDVTVGDAKTYAWFLVCDNLPAPIILGTTWIDTHVETILLQHQTIKLLSGTLVSIGSDVEDAKRKRRVDWVRVAKSSIVPACS
jgi:hypothetical protein